MGDTEDSGPDNIEERIYKEIDREIFRQSLIAYFFATLTGVIGFFILYASHDTRMVSDPVIAEVLRDIGIAFLVAALVGIFYDVFNKRVGRARAKIKMEKDTGSLIAMGSKIESLVKELAGLDNPVRRIRGVLERELRPGIKYSPVIQSVVRLLDEIFRIRQLCDSKQTKEVHEYMRLTGWVLEKYAVRLATQTRTILEGMTAADDTVYSSDYFPPERRAMTLEILATQMRAMRSNDSYDSVTNLWLYVNLSRSYIDATRSALQNGLKIRRIFNICHEQSKGRNSRGLYRAFELARLQIAEFPEKTFEYKFLTNESLNRLNPDILNAAGLYDRAAMKTTYFGHFHHAADGKMLRFDPKDEVDMEGLAIVVYPLDGENDECAARRRLFEHLWEVADARGADEVLASITGMRVENGYGYSGERRVTERRREMA